MKATSPLDGRRVEELVRRHQASVRGFLAFLGCPASHLDDLTQDVFLAVIASGFEERGPASSAAYLRRVAHHLLLKVLRRERRQQPLVEPEAAEQAWVLYEGDDGGGRYQSALRACLQRLNARAREVLRRRYGEAEPRTTIAAGLGLSEAGVASILVRARRRLRDCVEARLESAEGAR